jgi:hypothetical protein
MLSRDEEHELALLEESLQEPTRRRLLRAVEGPVWRHRWKVRAALAFGILVWGVGGVTGAEDVTYDGFLVTTLVTSYWLTMVMRYRPAPPPDGGGPRRRPGAPRRPGGR